MDNVSKVLFKEIMLYVKEFETLGNKWCEENDLASVARARSYGKKIISAMKPFIEASIKETDAAVAAEAVKLATPVVEPVVEVVVEPVAEVVAEPVVEVVEQVVEPVVEVVPEVVPVIEKKEVEQKNKGFNFNKRK